MQEFHLTPERPGIRLSKLLEENGVCLDMPCAGNHTCGKCRVYASGELSEISPPEAALLSRAHAQEGVRLACFARAMGPVTLRLTGGGGEQILTGGALGEITAARPLLEEGEYGVAVDIGTTTVVCRLYGREGGAPLAVESALNRQQPYGSDVISRINYGIQNGNEAVCRAIREQLEEMILRLCAAAGVPRALVKRAVVTGNTTMLHFFDGLDPRGIGFVPFTPESLFGCVCTGALEGIAAWLPPCVSAYVGADLVCCLLCSGMLEKGDTALIVDIGTNGEMALLHDGALWCCSTAAGPAFEGAGISAGMVASDGAISHVRYDPARQVLDWQTIGDAPARGLCGSGVVEAVAALLEAGLIDGGGRLEAPPGHPLAGSVDERPDAETQFVFPGSAVCLTQGDVRQIQLAKAAIHGGMCTLLDACGIGPEALDVLYICGGFGSFLSLSAAEKIRLIPPGTGERAVVLGNGALTGASMVLLDRESREKAGRAAAECRYIELSASGSFMDHYVASMAFADMEDEE